MLSFLFEFTVTNDLELDYSLLCGEYKKPALRLCSVAVAVAYMRIYENSETNETFKVLFNKVKCTFFCSN